MLNSSDYNEGAFSGTFWVFESGSHLPLSHPLVQVSVEGIWQYFFSLYKDITCFAISLIQTETSSLAEVRHGQQAPCTGDREEGGPSSKSASRRCKSTFQVDAVMLLVFNWRRQNGGLETVK